MLETPPAPAPLLPARGYFNVEELFSASAYAGFNAYSKKEILKRAQTVLKAGGYYTGPPDGVTGPGTQRAVIDWQRNSGLPVTGKLDAASLEKLGLTGINQMAAPAPVQRPAPSRPAPSKQSLAGCHTSMYRDDRPGMASNRHAAESIKQSFTLGPAEPKASAMRSSLSSHSSTRPASSLPPSAALAHAGAAAG